MTTPAEAYQQRLLETAQRIFDRKPVPEAIAQAFLATPRHRFINRFRTYDHQAWVTVNEENLDEHLSTLYSDQALRLVEDEKGETVSSISQPSLVLYMLYMLQLEPGQTIFELGAGSGWNAALMGHLVGPHGRVYSTEILPGQAQEAANNIAALGIDNVHVIATDGGAGYAAGAPFDRVIFTAGTYDLPHFFYDQIKDGGLLLVVIKIEGGGDTLFLLKKVANHFEAIDALPCGFVPVTGQYAMTDLNPIDLAAWSAWGQLKTQILFRRPFWWNGKDPDNRWRTIGIRSFLNITEPAYQTFLEKNPEAPLPATNYFFGLWLPDSQSLALIRDNQIIAYGNTAAFEQLMSDIHRWVDWGMPIAACYNLAVYPADQPLTVQENQWLMPRHESNFLWSLPFQGNSG